MNIFSSDKLLILNYRAGSGGKFLANCLGLSSKCVLQDADLAQQQLDGKLNPAQKFDLIMNRLGEEKMFWKDLGLGDSEYFGTNLSTTNQDLQLNLICDLVNNQDLFFVAASHSVINLKSILTKFSKAKIINFVNSTNFLITYRKEFLNQQTKYWNNIKGTDWPDTPPNSIDEIHALPNSIQNELENNFKNTIYNHVICTTDNVQSIMNSGHQLISVWDCDWYFDVDVTINSVQHIYTSLELTDFNPDWIRLYWTEWIKKLHLPPEF